MYIKQNSKPIVRMDSSHRGASFYVEHTIKRTMVMLTSMCTVKRPGRHRRDPVASEYVPPRRRSPLIATETDESVVLHRAALRRSMLQRQVWTPSVQRGGTHILHHCSIQERYIPCFLWLSKQKTDNTKVVWNSVVKLLAKGKFKRQLVCDEFNKIWSNRFQIKLKLTPNETQNG
jgi:hypothetical protein